MIGGIWGFMSYFILAFLYFAVKTSFIFWIPALTIFLPGLLSVLFYISKDAGPHIFLSVLYGILLSFIFAGIYSLRKRKAVKKPRKKTKKRIRS